MAHNRQRARRGFGDEGDLRLHDLALVDIRMPGMDGLSLLSRVQEVKPELSIVIITGHGDMDTGSSGPTRQQ